MNQNEFSLGKKNQVKWLEANRFDEIFSTNKNNQMKPINLQLNPLITTKERG